MQASEIKPLTPKEFFEKHGLQESKELLKSQDTSFGDANFFKNLQDIVDLFELLQSVNLRKSDFEAMHPGANLCNFDKEKLVYFGNGSEGINSQWSTWCACLGMLHLESIENMESCQ